MRLYEAREGFVVGAYARVTKDSRFGHDRPPGTLVELCNFDASDDTWEVKEADSTNKWTFWSKASELELAEIEPSAEEIAELFGVPTPCTACGCPTNGRH